MALTHNIDDLSGCTEIKANQERIESGDKALVSRNATLLQELNRNLSEVRWRTSIRTGLTEYHADRSSVPGTRQGRKVSPSERAMAYSIGRAE